MESNFHTKFEIENPDSDWDEPVEADPQNAEKMVQLSELIQNMHPTVAWDIIKSQALPSMRLLDLILDWIVSCSPSNTNCTKFQSLLQHLEEILEEVGKLVEACLIPACDPEIQTQDCFQIGSLVKRALGYNCSKWYKRATPSAEYQHYLERISKENSKGTNPTTDPHLNVKLEVNDNGLSLDASQLYICHKCDRKYKTPDEFNTHLLKCNAHQGSTNWTRSDGKYFCAVQGCNLSQSWTTSTGVWKHIVKCHSTMQDQSLFTCDFCEKSYPNRSLVNEHMNRAHMKKFKCDICGRGFGDNTSRKSHMRIHLGEKPYQCDQCEYKSASSGGLTTHKKIMHNDNRPKEHCCDKCGKRFALKSNLKEHIRSHSSEKLFLCGVCGKGLKNKQCLNRHLFTHGIKYTCEVCAKNFASFSSLSIHRRDKHQLLNLPHEHTKDIKSLLELSAPSNLKEEIGTHSSKKAFHCGVCGKGLKNKQCLNRHLFTHGIKYTCEVCSKDFVSVSTLTIHRRDKHQLLHLPIEDSQDEDIKSVLELSLPSKSPS